MKISKLFDDRFKEQLVKVSTTQIQGDEDTNASISYVGYLIDRDDAGIYLGDTGNEEVKFISWFQLIGIDNYNPGEDMDTPEIAN